MSMVLTLAEARYSLSRPALYFPGADLHNTVSPLDGEHVEHRRHDRRLRGGAADVLVVVVVQGEEVPVGVDRRQPLIVLLGPGTVHQRVRLVGMAVEARDEEVASPRRFRSAGSHSAA
jgi:hypothetical protein